MKNKYARSPVFYWGTGVSFFLKSILKGTKFYFTSFINFLKFSAISLDRVWCK